MAKISLTYEEVETVKETLSLAVTKMKLWPNEEELLQKRSIIMSIIFKLENPKENNGKDKEK